MARMRDIQIFDSLGHFPYLTVRLCEIRGDFGDSQSNRRVLRLVLSIRVDRRVTPIAEEYKNTHAGTNSHAAYSERRE